MLFGGHKWYVDRAENGDIYMMYNATVVGGALKSTSSLTVVMFVPIY